MGSAMPLHIAQTSRGLSAVAEFLVILCNGRPLICARPQFTY